MKQLYIISRDDGANKIGVSYEPKNRFRQIQHCSGHKMKLQYESEPLPEYRQIERNAHILFDRFALGGEWFRITTCDAIAAIKRLLAELKLPRQQTIKLDAIDKINAGRSIPLTRNEIIELELNGRFGEFWANSRREAIAHWAAYGEITIKRRKKMWEDGRKLKLEVANA